jgi:hypothetical protein
LVEFERQDQIAASAPRGDIPEIISQMIAIRTQLEGLLSSGSTPYCAINGLSALLDSTSSIISSAEDWATIQSTWSAQQLAGHEQRVIREWTSAYEAFHSAQETIKADCSFQDT